MRIGGINSSGVFENGETLKSFKTVGIPVLNGGSRWTPDGRNLAYRVSQKDAVNLWLQPIEGGKARAITNFRTGISTILLSGPTVHAFIWPTGIQFAMRYSSRIFISNDLSLLDVAHAERLQRRDGSADCRCELPDTASMLDTCPNFPMSSRLTCMPFLRSDQ